MPGLAETFLSSTKPRLQDNGRVPENECVPAAARACARSLLTRPVLSASLCVDLRVGLNKGHPTTALEKRTRPSHRKGLSSTKTKFVRSVVREVAGFAPYERRVMELLRNSKVRLRASV